MNYNKEFGRIIRKHLEQDPKKRDDAALVCRLLKLRRLQRKQQNLFK